MAVKLKLVDVTKLQKASFIVSQETKKAVADAKVMLDKQEEFLKNGGMDRQKLRAFINSDRWTAQQKQKAREELLRFHGELKTNMAEAATAKHKELNFASRMLQQGKVQASTTRKKRSGFV